MSDTNTLNSQPLWRWAELTAGLTGVATVGPDVQRVCVDSRLVEVGDLFIALAGDPGPRFNPSYTSEVNGHDFLAHAFANGAVGAVVDRALEDSLKQYPVVKVEDTYDGLWRLGELARGRITGDVVAVTGSSGKTTAKGFMSAALDAYAPPGSFNNHIGVPLSLANSPATISAGVFEIGTNHPGEIEPLARMVHPTVAVLLNVHSAHIENFPSRQSLLNEKVSIFNALDNKSMAVSEVNLGLGFGLTFGITSDADAWVKGLVGDVATIVVSKRQLKAKIPGGGLHRAQTLAATLLVCELLGRDLALACDLPETVIPVGRGNVHRVGSVSLYDDSYNANPDSMSAAIQSFLEGGTSGENIAIIGEMLELGDQSDLAHMSLYESLKLMGRVYCVGRGTKRLAEKLGVPWFEEADRALRAQVVANLSPSSRIFVKGSNRVFWANGFVGALLKDIESK